MRVLIFAVLLFFLTQHQLASAQSKHVWRALASGKVVALMRHAKAPGSKEGANFSLYDCKTQRNLSAAGRSQARRTGAYFRRRGIKQASVYSSQYCRCRQTAQLLRLGGVNLNSSLNMLKQGAAGSYQTGALASLVRNASNGSATIIVTHKTNIRALTGVTPSSGETLLVNLAGKVVGRIPPR